MLLECAHSIILVLCLHILLLLSFSTLEKDKRGPQYMHADPPLALYNICKYTNALKYLIVLISHTPR